MRNCSVFVLDYSMTCAQLWGHKGRLYVSIIKQDLTSDVSLLKEKCSITLDIKQTFRIAQIEKIYMENFLNFYTSFFLNILQSHNFLTLHCELKNFNNSEPFSGLWCTSLNIKHIMAFFNSACLCHCSEV